MYIKYLDVDINTPTCKPSSQTLADISYVIAIVHVTQ